MKARKHATRCMAVLLLAVGCIASMFEFMPLSDMPRIVAGAAESDAVTSVAPSRALQGFLGGPLEHLFIQLLFIMAACRWVGKLTSRLGLSAVVGEMVAGIMLGPSLFGWLAPRAFAFVFPMESIEVLKLLSQLGVCFFMFVVGMELNLSHLRTRAGVALVVSHASILVPFVLGLLLAYILFEDFAGPQATFNSFALFMGISMSITAFPVLVRILQERNLSTTALGGAAIACAAIDDVTAWSILAFVVCISRSSSMDTAVVTLILAMLFIGVMVLGVRRVLPSLLGANTMKKGELASGALVVVVWFVIAAALTSEVIGIHSLFGAFLAGVTMPRVDGFCERISERLHDFTGVLLLPLFFAVTGLRTQVGLLSDVEGWLLCLLIVVAATVGKLGASAIAARLTGMTWPESMQLGALMNTRGLMELVALNIGYDLRILSPEIFTMLVIMALLTTLLTGPLLTLFSKRRGPLVSL